jgi:putative Mg2+ transporter-C (MgtC) family protein
MIDPISSSLDPAILWYILPKFFIAALVGATLGFMREKQNKPAGIKTHMFLCIGSTLFTCASYISVMQSHGDPSRVLAQIVSGIGFIGAGAIFKSSTDQSKVYGLTSAAFLWAVCALGVLVGLGGYLLTLLLTALIILFTQISLKFERKYFNDV